MISIKEEAAMLTQKYCDGEITAEEHARLSELLIADESARRTYLRIVGFDASMQAYADVNDALDVVPLLPVVNSPANDSMWPTISMGWLGSSLLVGLLCAVAIGVGAFLGEGAPEPRLVTVISSNNLVFSDGRNAVANGQEIDGPILIEKGLLTIGLAGGGIVSLEGPCEFEMIDQFVARLKSGKLVAYCGDDAEKLTVETPTGEYIDIGTEFGILVNDDFSSSLHVFDGQVVASGSRSNGKKSVLVEAASSLKTIADGTQEEMGMVDMVHFDQLRKSLSVGSVNEEFSEPLFENKNHEEKHWKQRAFRANNCKTEITASNPLATGLGSYLHVSADAEPNWPKSDPLPLMSVQWEYGQVENGVDLTKPHTIECVVRLDCEPIDVRNLEMFGANEPTWKRRSWVLNSSDILNEDGVQMWTVFHSSKPGATDKYQFLKLKRLVTYYMFVEIDPVLNKYRTTVSDGENRIWTELYDGSPAPLNVGAGALGKILWQVRGYPGKKLAFDIDAVRIRNRPVFCHGENPIVAPIESTETVSHRADSDSRASTSNESSAATNSDKQPNRNIGKLFESIDEKKSTDVATGSPPATIPVKVPLPEPPVGSFWKETFADDFDGDQIDRSKWKILGDTVRKYGFWRQDHSRVDGNGNLVIRVDKEIDPATSKTNFCAGGLESRNLFEQKFGYFECRYKLLRDNGSGYHCAFWLQSETMMDVADEGRNGTEIDIIEKFHHDNVIQHCLHWDGYGDEHKSSKFEFDWPGIKDGFHIFGMKWTENEYTFYVDGVETWKTSAGGVSQVPAFLRLTTEFSQGWNGDINSADLPDEFTVDYVRVYQAVDQ